MILSTRKKAGCPQKSPGASPHETKRLLDEGFGIAEIMEQRGLAESTVLGHLDRLVMAGEHVTIGHLLPPAERLAEIEAAFQKSEDLRLTPVREFLGEDYPYLELALVRLDMRQRGMFD